MPDFGISEALLASTLAETAATAGETAAVAGTAAEAGVGAGLAGAEAGAAGAGLAGADFAGEVGVGAVPLGEAGGLASTGAGTAALGTGAGALGEAAPGVLADLSAAAPADFTGGALGAGNAFGLPAGSEVSGPTLLSAPSAAATPATSAAPTPAAAGLTNNAPASLLPASGGGAGAITSPGITGASTPIDALAGQAGAGGFQGSGALDALSGQSGRAGFYGAGTPTAGDKIGDFAGKAGDYLLGHPGVAMTGLLAAQRLFQGNPAYPAETQIGNLAAGTAGTAASLTAPLTTGVLPPGEQQLVNAGTQSAIAAAKSAYGNLGLSGSTMEADKVAQIKQDAAAQEAQIANDLVKTGATYSGQSLQAYNDLLKAQMDSDKSYRDALYNFSRSLGAAGYTPNAANA